MPRFVDNAPDAVLATAKEMLAKGLVEGTAGNISARQSDGTVCVTPPSIDYEQMTLDDLVVVPEKVDEQFAGVYEYMRQN